MKQQEEILGDKEQFHPPVGFAILLTILASLIGALLAVYLLLTA